jgi:hypothetical protein
MTTGFDTPDALTVATAPAAVVPSFAPTLASLPVSFTPGDGPSLPVVTVIAGGPDWPQQASDAIRSGSRGVIVSDPSVAAVSSILAAADLAEEHRARVVLAEPFAGDSGLLTHRTDLIHHLAAVDTLSITHVSAGGDAASQLLAVLRTARALGRHAIDLRSFVATAHGFTASGTAADGAVFTALGVRTSASVAGQTIRGYGFARTVEIRLFGAETAAPARISITNVDGQLVVPDVFETADRAAWQRLRDELAAPAVEGQSELRLFASDVETVLAA